MTLLRSIRLRLTLWYMLILAAILVLFAAGVYVTIRHSLRDQLDDSVEKRTFLVLDLVTFDADRVPHLEGVSDPDPADPDPDEQFQRLFDLNGAVLFDSTAGFGQVPVDARAVAEARAGRIHRGTAGVDNEALIYTVPVRDGGDIVGVLQVGETTEDYRETLDTLLLIFAVSLPSALVLASFGGWWLSSRALAPIDRVTRAANQISDGGDLSRRLNLDLPDDEVGRLARTFDEMIGRLDRAFERQRQFTADASHELRTPLTAVRGQIEVALDRPRDPAEYQRVLQAVNEQVERMTRLVRGLLVLARSDAGAMKIQREPLDLADLVQSVADQVRPLAQQKGLQLTVEGDGALPAHGDEDLLLQLMLNLADNAIKYTTEGSVTLGWRSGRRASLFVRDTGPGVPPEHRDRVFERFYRADAARSPQEGSAGLGLAIGRWIAEAHGGTLSLESATGETTFTLELPLA